MKPTQINMNSQLDQGKQLIKDQMEALKIGEKIL